MISEECSCVQRRFHEHELPSKSPPPECRVGVVARAAVSSPGVAVGGALLLLGVCGSALWRRRSENKVSDSVKRQPVLLEDEEEKVFVV